MKEVYVQIECFYKVTATKAILNINADKKKMFLFLFFLQYVKFIRKRLCRMALNIEDIKKYKNISKSMLESALESEYLELENMYISFSKYGFFMKKIKYKQILKKYSEEFTSDNTQKLDLIEETLFEKQYFHFFGEYEGFDIVKRILSSNYYNIKNFEIAQTTGGEYKKKMDSLFFIPMSKIQFRFPIGEKVSLIPKPSFLKLVQLLINEK